MTTTAPDTRVQNNIAQDIPWCLSDEHRAWRAAIREFVEAKLAPSAAQRNIDATFDDGLCSEIGDLGVYGLMVPEGHGGGGANVTSLCLTIEEIARVDSGVAASVHVQSIATALLSHLANDDWQADLLNELLPRLISGEDFISFGLTEPSGGSDAGNIATRALRDGDGWIINGAKEFITNAGIPRSRYVILFAASGDAVAPGGRPRVSSFLVPLDAPGVHVGRSYDKMGWRTSDTHPLFFQDVRVPGSALLGQEGKGYGEALAFLTWARLPIASMSVGLAQGCLDETLRFVAARQSFNAPLASHQAVAFTIADIAAMTSTARTVTYDACYRHDHGYPFQQEAAICKLVASELANRVAYAATQAHGGYGFMNETAVARHYADARILTIGEGTSEVQRLLIARSLGLPI